MKINIFLENIYENFELNLDEKKILQKSKKMFKFFIDEKAVFEKSCLVDYDLSSIYFDIVFCDNEKIHEINVEYRKKDRPTDVITFALFADSPKEERFIFDGEINLGEIIVSLDKTKEQANDKEHSFEEELYFLISHGLMHLLGFDHLTDEDLEYMLSWQSKSME